MVATEQQTQPKPAQTPALKPVEDFDLNRAKVFGQVHHVWSKFEHTFLRVAVTEPMMPKAAPMDGANGSEAKEEAWAKARTQYITARIENGLLHGELVTVMPGDWVTIDGYLADMPYDESIREFLNDVQAPRAQKKNGSFLGGKIIDAFPNKEDWDKVRVKRVNTRLEVVDLQIHQGAGNRESVNFAEVEGVVASTWRWDGDLYARLAIYDRYAQALPGTGKNGHPRRKPHYVTVVFPDSLISGRTIELHEKYRVRVRGAVLMRLYTETLREMLIRNAKIGLLLAEIPNADQIGAYKAARSATYVVAASAQVFGRFTFKPETAADTVD